MRLRRAARWLMALSLVGLIWSSVAQARRFVYVTDVNSSELSQYARAHGGLAPLAPPTVSTTNQPVGIAAAPGGRDVYVTTDYPQSALLHYAVGRDGILVLRDMAAVPSTAVLDEPVVVSPNRRSVYAIDTAGFGSLLQYTVGFGGSLTPKTPASVPDTGTGPTGLIVSPDSRSVYLVNDETGTATVSQYTVGADGTLTPKTPATVPAGQDAFASASSIVLSHNGRSAYVSDYEALLPNLGYISQYTVNSDGTLTPLSPATVPANGHPTQLAVSLDDRSVYATSQTFAGTVLTFHVGDGGRLTPLPGSVSAGAYPFGIAVAGRCRFTSFGPSCRQRVYVANSGSNDVSVYSVGTGGTPVPGSPATVPAGANPLNIAVANQTR